MMLSSPVTTLVGSVCRASISSFQPASSSTVTHSSCNSTSE